MASTSAPSQILVARSWGSYIGPGAFGFTQTEVIPLTTVFTPPADCISDWQNALAVSRPVGCYPESWARYQFTGDLFYSPGVCPASFEWLNVANALFGTDQTVTVAMCCPPGMTTTSVSAHSTYCYRDNIFPSSDPSASTVLDYNSAWPVSVAWKNEDLSSFDPPSAPRNALRSYYHLDLLSSSTSQASATRSITSTITSPPSRPTTAASPTPTHHHSGGFSTGDKIGTGVGVPAAVILTAAIYWYFRRLRRSRPASPEGGDAAITAEPGASMTEIYGAERVEAPDTGQAAEAGGTSIAELESGLRAVEVDGTNARPVG